MGGRVTQTNPLTLGRGVTPKYPDTSRPGWGQQLCHVKSSIKASPEKKMRGVHLSLVDSRERGGQ